MAEVLEMFTSKEEQEEIRELSNANAFKVQFENAEKLLNTLESIDGTLKRIEQRLDDEKQHELIKEAVSHALLGEKYNSTPTSV